MFGWFKKKPKPADPAEVYADMRENLFTLDPKSVGILPDNRGESVWCVIMEFARPGAIVTLASFKDNSTSLYFSNGGGVIGAGAHEAVAAATQSFLATAQKYVTQFESTSTYPAPRPEMVRFFLRTFDSVKTTEANEEDLGNERHALTPLFYAAHEVIGQVRMCSEKK